MVKPKQTPQFAQKKILAEKMHFYKIKNVHIEMYKQLPS